MPLLPVLGFFPIKSSFFWGEDFFFFKEKGSNWRRGNAQ
jgi:hypothetical protein